jgi:hypothetical protein
MKKSPQFQNKYQFCIKAISARQKEQLEYRLWFTGIASSIQIGRKYIFVKVRNNRYDVFMTSKQEREWAWNMIWDVR